jgi:hypothetical protein
MRLQNDEIVMDKEEFLTNTLLAGIACQLLAKITKEEISHWMECLSEQADEQYRLRTPKQHEDMINAYVQISQQ